MYCLEIHCVSRMLEWNNWLLFRTRRRIVMPTSKPRVFMMQIDGTIRPSTCLWVRARMNGCSLLSLSFELWIFSCRDTFSKCVNLCCCRSLMKNPGAPAGKIDISIRVFFIQVCVERRRNLSGASLSSYAFLKTNKQFLMYFSSRLVRTASLKAFSIRLLEPRAIWAGVSWQSDSVLILLRWSVYGMLEMKASLGI